jgi:type VI secretion system protein ImpB
MISLFQNEIPKARVNIQLSVHTGGAQKKAEPPVTLMVVGDYSNGAEQRPLSEGEKINITKNNMDSVLAEFSPSLNLAVENTQAGDGSEENVTALYWDVYFDLMETIKRRLDENGIPATRPQMDVTIRNAGVSGDQEAAR